MNHLKENKVIIIVILTTMVLFAGYKYRLNDQDANVVIQGTSSNRIDGSACGSNKKCASKICANHTCVKHSCNESYTGCDCVDGGCFPNSASSKSQKWS